MAGQDDDTTRKGPWTENEDFQLVFYVRMFGDRRWDFIAKVSGLKVAGVKPNIKSLGCNFCVKEKYQTVKNFSHVLTFFSCVYPHKYVFLGIIFVFVGFFNLQV